MSNRKANTVKDIRASRLALLEKVPYRSSKTGSANENLRNRGRQPWTPVCLIATSPSASSVPVAVPFSCGSLPALPLSSFSECPSAFSRSVPFGVSCSSTPTFAECILPVVWHLLILLRQVPNIVSENQLRQIILCIEI